MSARSIRRLVLPICLVALCGLLGAAAWLLQPSLLAGSSPEQRARLDQFTAARQRWTTAGPRHYRLEIQHGDPAFRCHAVAEIRDTTIVAVEQNNCPTPPQTVAELFDQIERHTTERVCGPNGCQCDGVIVADASYDATLGYPTQVSLRIDESQRTPWPIQDRIRAALGGGWNAFTGAAMACTAMGMVDPQTEVLSLTPLP